MARRPALALARPRPVPGGLALPWRRVIELAVLAASLTVLGYMAARFTPLFAVQDVVVTGARGSVADEVRVTIADLDGESLVGLDGDELVRSLEALPSVRSVSYDRAFPHTLRVSVVAENPLAVVQGGGSRWLVSDSGRVIRRLPLTAKIAWPLIPLTPTAPLSPGTRITEPDTLLALRTLSTLPKHFPGRIESVSAGPEDVTLDLRRGGEVRLGEPTLLGLKLQVAAKVIRSLTSDERAVLGYVDVSVPDRAVSADNTQLEG